MLQVISYWRTTADFIGIFEEAEGGLESHGNRGKMIRSLIFRRWGAGMSCEPEAFTWLAVS